jgi:hypothetical protein
MNGGIMPIGVVENKKQHLYEEWLQHLYEEWLLAKQDARNWKDRAVMAEEEMRVVRRMLRELQGHVSGFRNNDKDAMAAGVQWAIDHIQSVLPEGVE